MIREMLIAVFFVSVVLAIEPMLSGSGFAPSLVQAQWYGSGDLKQIQEDRGQR
jgi:hypothetical protein